MPINNVSMHNIPINKGNVSQVKKSEQSQNVSEITPISAKTDSADFSLVLSQQQQDTINDTIGYDQPSAKERGAVDAYQQVATQEKREQVIESMSFHFVV